ncbi:MAG: CapA family protein [Myxococcota bacterium]
MLSGACADGADPPPPPLADTGTSRAAGSASASRRPRPSVLISAVGDCTLGGEQEQFRALLAAHGDDPAFPFSGVREVLAADDLTIANLEVALTDLPRRKDKKVTFRGRPSNVAVLRAGSVEVVNVANNHSGDCGGLGAADTVRHLEAAGIGAFGYERIDRRTIRGIEVVNIGYTGGYLGVKSHVVRAVRENKLPRTVVIVSFHWGGEDRYDPTPVQYELGRAAVDAGADLVLGHHPHVLQGIEHYRGRPIVYSLGNFVFAGDDHPSDLDSMIYRVRFALGDDGVERISETIIPVSISSHLERNDVHPRILQGDEAKRVRTKMARLTERLHLPGNGR